VVCGLGFVVTATREGRNYKLQDYKIKIDLQPQTPNSKPQTDSKSGGSLEKITPADGGRTGVLADLK
jgi:hypothetical protein